MKIVIVSDIHANLEALTSIPERYDELWVLGDLVDYGPSPREVIDFVRSHATVVVRGNHDHAVAFGEDPCCSPAFRAMASATLAYTKAILSPDDLEYLSKLPLIAERVVDGIRFLLCHAAPSDPLYKYVPPDSNLWDSEAERRPYSSALRSVHRQFDHCESRQPGSTQAGQSAGLLRDLGSRDRAALVRLRNRPDGS
jgi:protein phosphatase